MTTQPAAAPIVVCPLRLLPQVVQEAGAADVVSVVNAHLMPPTPPGIDPVRHLKLPMSEGDRAQDSGSPHPHIAAIARLIEYARAWDQKAPLVVHCFSGLNRSPAAAYIILCALNPDVPEVLLAHRLRMASETAAPNRQMVVLADQLLGRSGRMTLALDAIGYGQPAAEARPFTLAA